MAARESRGLERASSILARPTGVRFGTLYGSLDSMPDTKVCSRCFEHLDWSAFSKRPNGRPGSFCKECQRENSKAHYRIHKAKHNAGRYARRIEERKKIRELLIKLKEQPCADCGERHPYWAMDFDHRDPVAKEFTIALATRTKSLTRVLLEVAKCDVVCALCHRYRTHEVARARKYARGVA